jgi:hypothetical protein
MEVESVYKLHIKKKINVLVVLILIHVATLKTDGKVVKLVL